MATSLDTEESALLLNNAFNDEELVNSIQHSSILLVGGGGIGCEVIKNLLLTGFTNITVIDLDTIDVSNLNRQFLFNKSHVCQSKAEVAASVASKNFAHCPGKVNVKPIHGSIQSPQFDVDFFKSFSIVINALDNKAARSHVNRMCLTAKVPLIESGSEGYVGQVFTIFKSGSACYECDGQKQDERTFASCTIRNTPSLPIHCIVWAKHLFAQLFGEEDSDNDVSPDMNDAELQGEKNGAKDETGTEGSKPMSTRAWAISKNYDPQSLFEKLFNVDIKYLLSMEKLWEKRRKPTPLTLDDLENDVVCQPSSSSTSNGDIHRKEASLKDQQKWTLKRCGEVFAESVRLLKERFDKEKSLVWDKDDESAMNFVTAVSNLRSFCFGIEMKSKFDVKSMAGNIIPAISSTNSIVGGIITLQALNLLKILPQLKSDETIIRKHCKHCYLRKVSLSARNLISSYDLEEPNPKCIVCSGQTPEIDLILSLEDTLMADFVEQVIIKRLNFVCPDILIDGTSSIIWSKDEADEESESEKEAFKSKKLSQFPNVKENTRLRVNDLIQEYSVIITIREGKVDPADNDGKFYKLVVAKEEDLKPKESITELASPEEKVVDEKPPDTNHDISISEDGDSLTVTSAGLKRAKTLSINSSNESNDVVTIDDDDSVGDDDDDCSSEDVMVTGEYNRVDPVEVVRGSGMDADDDDYESDSCDIIEIPSAEVKRKHGDSDDEILEKESAKKKRL